MHLPFGKIILCIILLLGGGHGYAQTQIDCKTEDGFLIKNANLQAWTPFGIEIFPTLDTSSGGFFISKDFNRLKIVAEGFQTIDSIFKPEIKVGSQLTLVLKANYTFMDEAVVSVSKESGKIKESPVSISIVKPYLTENKVATDVSQSLDQVPGVNIADNQINIRSGNGWSYGAGSRVAVMLDDLPMLSADAQAAQFTFMPIENIESVEVVKSAGSVLYGSSAINGVVNLRSRPVSDTPEARVTAFAMLYDKAPKASLNWRNKANPVFGSNGYYSTKLGRTDFTAMYNVLNNPGYRMHEFENRGRITLRTKTRSKTISGLEWGQTTSAQIGKSGSFLLWQNFDKGYIPLDSGYNYSNSSKLSIDPVVTLTRKKWKHQCLSRFLFLDNQIDNGDTVNQSNGSSFVYTEFRSSVFIVPKILHLTMGLVHSQGETHSPLFSGAQTTANNAAYTQLLYKKKRINAMAGARYEMYTLNQFAQNRPVFRLGTTYAAARFTYLRASWGQGFRFPSMAEAFISTSAGNIYIYPNNSLKPETSSGGEIGLKQGYRIGKFKAYADISAFRTAYQNLMEFTFAQWANFNAPLLGFGFKSINTAKATITGFEIETAGTGNIGKVNVQLLGGYTYTLPVSNNPEAVFVKDFNGNGLSFANTRADSNMFLKYRYKHLFRADVQGRVGKWEAGLSVRYNSKMLNMDNSFVTLIDPTIRVAWDRLGSNTIVDCRVAVYITEKIKVNIQIVNLFNVLYMNRPADLRPPRTYQIQFSWRL